MEPNPTPILQLAIGLVVDLGLQRAPATMRLIPTSLVNDTLATLKGKGFGQKEHSLEDMRAVLGCYYICALWVSDPPHSMHSRLGCMSRVLTRGHRSTSLFRRTHAFPYSSYLDHCCDVLLDAHEHESDEFLVALVRLQQLAHRIYIVLPNPDSDPRPSSGSHAAMFMSIAAMRRELDTLIHSQSMAVRNNCMSRVQRCCCSNAIAYHR